MEEEDHCRVCWGGPRGLADALIAPCGCTGTSGLIHVSCLFSWQLEKMRSLRDPMLCEVCGRQYEVPAQAASAWAAANREAAAGIAREIRVAARWQAARSALLWAGRVLLWGARVVVTLRHHWFRLGQVAYLTMEPEDVPQVKAGFLPPPEVRMRPFLDLAVRAVAIQYVTENMLGPGAGWQGGWQGQLAQLALVAAAAAGTRMLRARPRLRWDAPGAPLRVPTGELLAGKLAMWVSLYASLKVSRLPALYLALFGPLSPRWLAEVTATGHYLLGAAWQNSMAEIKLALQTAWLQRLFQARPAALAALHAALLAGSGSIGAWMRRWVKRWMGA